MTKKESITFLVTGDFKKTIEKYCEEHGNISMSSFVTTLVAKKLIEEKYLEVNT